MKGEKAPYYPYYKKIFRGYGRDDKIKRKNTEVLKTFNQVADSDDLFGVFRDNIIMVDADDPTTAKIIYNILVYLECKFYYQDTTRGRHFFFLKPKDLEIKNKTHTNTAVGLEIDLKTTINDGTKLVKTLDNDRINYVVNKTKLRNGNIEDRPIIEGPHGGDLIEYPYWLMPHNLTIEFLNMESGDGRNQKLFNYILPLQRLGLSREQIRNTIRLINQFVLVDSLPRRELDIILRDEAFPTNNELYIYRAKGERVAKLDYELFSNHLIKTYNIIKLNDLLYYYVNNHYVRLTDEEVEGLIIDTLRNTTRNMRKEVIPYLNKRAPVVEAQSNERFILFKNGIYDVISKQMIEPSPDYVIVNYIPFNYNPGAEEEPLLNECLDGISCGSKEIKKLLIQIFAYCMYRKNSLGKIFFLSGSGKNGKSTYIDLIKYILGKSNVSMEMSKTINGNFGRSTMINKLVNFADDDISKTWSYTDYIKKLATGEPIDYVKKGKDAVYFEHNIKAVFSFNQLPKIEDNSEGMNSRLVIIPFNAKFDRGKKLKADFKDRIKTKAVAEYFIKLAVDELVGLLDSGFIECSEVAAATKEYQLENDPVLKWFTEIDVNTVILHHTSRDVHNHFRRWFYEEYGKTDDAPSQTMLTQRIKKAFGYEVKVSKIDNKSCRIFVGVN